MRVVIIYESMFGNTHAIAEAVGAGFTGADVSVIPVGQATEEVVAGADLVVVGGPTHAHGMSRSTTRSSAVSMASEPGNELPLDPDAEGPGLREWFDALRTCTGPAAAFDTRMPGPIALTGHASKGISKRLRHHGFDEIAEPRSFLVTKQNQLPSEEAEHATAWGEQLASTMSRRMQANV